MEQVPKLHEYVGKEAYISFTVKLVEDLQVGAIPHTFQDSVYRMNIGFTDTQHYHSHLSLITSTIHAIRLGISILSVDIVVHF